MRKKRLFPLFLVGVMSLQMMPSAYAATKTYSDVSQKDWFYDSVSYMTEHGLMAGIGSGEFSPESSMTRGMLSTVMYRHDGSPAYSAGKTFSDIQSDTWCRDAVLWAASQEIVAGYEDGTFRASANITREQMAAILYRYSVKQGLLMKKSTADLSRYSDQSAVSPWAREAIAWAVANSIIAGTDEGKLLPQGYATRAQVAAILTRFYKAVDEEKADATQTPTEKPGNTSSGGSHGGSSGGNQGGGGSHTPSTPSAPTAAAILEQAAAALNITLAEEDTASHITKNVGMKTSQGDVAISWASSNTAVISNEGAVTRQSTPEDVTLTATLTYQGQSVQKEFVLHVDKLPSDVEITPVSKEELLRKDVSIAMDDDRAYIVSIDGQFYADKVSSADDALNAIESVQTTVGLTDADSELTPIVINEDEFGTAYTFQQMYDSMPVYGRHITVATNSDDAAVSLSSGVLPSAQLNSLSEGISEAEAIQIAENDAGNGLFAVKDSVEKVVWAIGNNAEDPVIAYIITIDDNDEATLGTLSIVISAKDGAILQKSDALTYAAETGSGLDELGVKKAFPVTVTPQKVGDREFSIYTMQDAVTHLAVYVGKFAVVGVKPYSSTSKTFEDPTAVSAYETIRTAASWYKKTFGRDSFDNKGTEVPVVIHTGAYLTWLPDGVGAQFMNNAAWRGSANEFNFFDNSDSLLQYPTTAVAVDVATHEYTHGVISSVTGDAFGNYGIPSSLNEGYADTMAALMTNDWDMGEEWIGRAGKNFDKLRDIANPNGSKRVFEKGPSKLSDPLYEENLRDNEGGAHGNSFLVSHPVYLMHKNGFGSTTQLAKLYYKSMALGYDSASDWWTMRRNVLKAASIMKCSDAQIQIIKNAFDECEIYDTGMLGQVTGTVMSADKKPIGNVSVRVTTIDGKVLYDGKTTDTGMFKLDIPEGSGYVLTLSKGGYKDFVSKSIKIRAEKATDLGSIELIADDVEEAYGFVNITVDPGEAANFEIEVAKDGKVISKGQPDSETGRLSLKLPACEKEWDAKNSHWTYTEYKVTATGKAFYPVEKWSWTEHLTAGANSDHDLTGYINDYTWTFSGVAQDASGAPVPNAAVRLMLKYGTQYRQTTTDANGRYTLRVTAFEEKDDADATDKAILTIEKPGYVSYSSGSSSYRPTISKAAETKETVTNVTLYQVPEAGKERDYRVVEGKVITAHPGKYTLSACIYHDPDTRPYYCDITVNADGSYACVLPFADNTKFDWYDLDYTNGIDIGDADYLTHPIYNIKVVGQTEYDPKPYDYVNVNYLSLNRYLHLDIYPDQWGFFIRETN